MPRPQLVGALEAARAGRLTIVSASTGSTAEVRDDVRRIRRHLGAVTRDEAVTVARRAASCSDGAEPFRAA